MACVIVVEANGLDYLCALDLGARRDQPTPIGEEFIPPIYAGLGGKRRNSLSSAFSISFQRSWCASLTACFAVPIQTGRLAPRSRISKAMLPFVTWAPPVPVVSQMLCPAMGIPPLAANVGSRAVPTLISVPCAA